MTTLPSQEILSKPSLATLSFILRHKELWPEGFEWNYMGCYSCAMGLALRLGWAAKAEQDPSKHGYSQLTFKTLAKELNLSEETARSFFHDADRPYQILFSEVTPIHVADLIDSYLEGNSP